MGAAIIADIGSNGGQEIKEGVALELGKWGRLGLHHHL
jgi:hypothetical protein